MIFINLKQSQFLGVQYPLTTYCIGWDYRKNREEDNRFMQIGKKCREMDVKIFVKPFILKHPLI